MNIGRLVRRYRVRANLSLREMAAKLGIPSVVLGEYERGRLEITRNVWYDILEILPELKRLYVRRDLDGNWYRLKE